MSGARWVHLYVRPQLVKSSGGSGPVWTRGGPGWNRVFFVRGAIKPGKKRQILQSNTGWMGRLQFQHLWLGSKLLRHFVSTFSFSTKSVQEVCHCIIDADFWTQSFGGAGSCWPPHQNRHWGNLFQTPSCSCSQHLYTPHILGDCTKVIREDCVHFLCLIPLVSHFICRRVLFCSSEEPVSLCCVKDSSSSYEMWLFVWYETIFVQHRHAVGISK